MLESHMDAKNYLDQARRNKKKIPGGVGGGGGRGNQSRNIVGHHGWLAKKIFNLKTPKNG